jgi:glycosyltransferase involved in cell wall biosynthesis
MNCITRVVQKNGNELRQIYVNGRFLSQTLSGVQRFAVEITDAMMRNWDAQANPQPVTLVPQHPTSTATSLHIEATGRRTGTLWEQTDLPRRASDGLLVNLGNTAPLLLKRQIIVIHDAAVFGAAESYSWKFRAWYKFMQRRVIAAGAHVVTVSEASRTEIARYFNLPKQSIGVISEGADHMHRIKPDPTVLTRHALTPNGFVLVVGNVAAHKNLAGLQIAARILAERDIPLVITGALNTAIFSGNAQGFPQPARYIGRVSDHELRALYEAAACFVYPTRYEGFGLTVIEAMACGCPVVASGIPALRETCDDAALFCDPDSPDDIARQMCRVLDEPELVSRLRSNGDRRASSLTWENAARSLTAIALDLAHQST